MGYTRLQKKALGFTVKNSTIARFYSEVSPLLSTANVTIQFGSKPLFENVSIKFADRNRYGLIGANGSGKSTFMKVLSSDLAPTHGNVTVGPDMRVATLQQNQFAYEEHSVVDTVIMGHPELWAIKEERDRIYNLPEMSEEEGIKVAELESEFAELDGYSAEAKAGELLLGVEISQELHYGPMSEVPPGEKLRVLLCQVLFADPDIMLLDEPTNNLDINTIRWLEGELIKRNSTMVIISHDRHFLNSVCTHMADLDYGEIRLYPGNYDNYMMASTMKREQLLRNNAKKSDEMKELRAFISRFSANASKSRQATARQRKLDKIQLDDMPVSSRKSPYIRFDQEKDLHRNVLTIDNISKAFDENKLFSKLNLMVEAGQKIAIIGPNGIGKTTLLRCVANQLATDGGQVQWAENAQLGYFPQDHSDEFSEDLLLGDWIRQFAPVGADEQVVRATLGRLLFSGDDVKKKTSVLSGGEKGRMLFGKLILQQNNVLLMDEPTNHLDMESIESLNLALDLFEGTLIFVSHDREFVSSLATQIIEISDDDVVHYLGTYEEYLAKQGLAG